MLKEVCVQQVAGQVSNSQSPCRAPSCNLCSWLRLRLLLSCTNICPALGMDCNTLSQGIASLASFLGTFGYKDAGDELAFPKKKLRARWMRKPDMPRVFISEIKACCNTVLCWRREGDMRTCPERQSLHRPLDVQACGRAAMFSMQRALDCSAVRP